eukprot:4242809-Pleurochrysis_carterae.AAC.1
MHVLHNLVSCECTRSSVASDVGAIAACVGVLRASSDAEVRALAAATLACVAEAGSRAQIVAAGGIDALSPLLSSENGACRQQASRALNSVADDVSSHSALASSLPALVTLAGSASDEARASAMGTVHKLCGGDDGAARGALASSGAAVSLLLLELSGGAAEQASAMASLHSLSASKEALATVVGSGGAQVLVGVLSGGSPEPSVRRRAAAVVSRLSAPPHSEAVASAGGAEALVGALSLGERAVTRGVAGALEQLARCDSGRAALLRSGVPACVRLLEDESDEVKLHALSVLEDVASDDQGKRKLLEAKAASVLVSLAKESGTVTVRRRSNDILCKLSNLQSEASALIAAGAVLPLVNILRDSSECEQASAIAALRRLTCGSETSGGQQAAVDAGCVGLLVQLLGPGTWPAQSDAMH